MVRALIQAHGNLMVVGDDSQSIYGFRGAQFKNILEFPKSFPQARVIKLEENYRSSQAILTLANTVISFAASGTVNVFGPITRPGTPLGASSCPMRKGSPSLSSANCGLCRNKAFPGRKWPSFFGPAIILLIWKSIFRKAAFLSSSTAAAS